MWTKASRGRTVELEKRTKRYPTDLTDEGWEIIDPSLPPPPQRGRRPPSAGKTPNLYQFSIGEPYQYRATTWVAPAFADSPENLLANGTTLTEKQAGFKVLPPRRSSNELLDG